MSKIGSMSAGALGALGWARSGAAVRGAGSGRPGAQLMGEGAQVVQQRNTATCLDSGGLLGTCRDGDLR